MKQAYSLRFKLTKYTRTHNAYLSVIFFAGTSSNIKTLFILLVKIIFNKSLNREFELHNSLDIFSKLINDTGKIRTPHFWCYNCKPLLLFYSSF